MEIVATTSLPAVDRPNADRWNAARSRQKSVAWRHWERFLRANSTWAIFTVLLYKKVLFKMSLRCVPLVTQGPQIFTRDTYHTNNWHERAAFQRSSFGRSRSGGRLLAMT